MKLGYREIQEHLRQDPGQEMLNSLNNDEFVEELKKKLSFDGLLKLHSDFDNCQKDLATALAEIKNQKVEAEMFQKDLVDEIKNLKEKISSLEKNSTN